jgi:hypothetical protein
MAGMARRGVNYWLIDIPTRRGVTMQYSKKLNTPMICNPQIWCKSFPINNIAKILNFFTKTTNMHKEKQNIHKERQKCLPYPNVLRNTIPEEWR